MKKVDHLPTKVEFEGTNNFRDMGGYPVGSDSIVRNGLLYRSDQLGNFTVADQQYFSDLGIKTVIDLRRQSERDEIMDNIEDASVNQIWLPVVAEGADVTNLRREVEAGTIDAEQARQYLISANRHFVGIHSPVYERFMDILLDEQAYPIVFHCSAGKDRAGFAAALALWALGADDQTVMHDYLATNHCTADYVDGLVDGLGDRWNVKATPEAVRTLMQVQEEFLQAAIDAADAQYGGIQQFIDRGLRFDDSKRQRLTELLT